jgi:N-methylhydantoinase A
MLKVPAVDIAEVGAGGGSLASIDAGGLLVVGPASAGADPGPACYGRGNDRPTVTDANMCLGYLNPEALAGGSLRVHRDKAADAVRRHVAEPLGLSVEEAAQGVRQIANVSMARAIRSVTVERGRDPRDMTIIAFGGGGPLHAVDVARILGVKRVIAPIMSGVFSAAGMLTADVEHNFVRAAQRKLSAVDADWLSAKLGELEAEGRATLAEEGYVGDGSVELKFAADLRYVGQSSELTIPFDPSRSLVDNLSGLAERFYREYRATYGYSTDEAAELAALRLTAVGKAKRLAFADAWVDAAAMRGQTGTRMVHFERGQPAIATKLLSRADISGEPQTGPAIIESYDTTIVVPAGATFRADAIGNVIIDIAA